ncbi:MAG: hypothetical protein EBY52_01825 [Actinobacteria bacterium]|nr:hypothetical protein [Actinomycetota bacterium]
MAYRQREPAAQLRALAEEVGACRACPRLVEWREQIGREKRKAYEDHDYWARGVPGFGDPAAHLLVVGLAPAAHGANRTGRMFTGDRSGDWLYRALYRAGYANQPDSVSVDDGLEMDGAWITSPVKCAPPENKPTTVERDTCRPFFGTAAQPGRHSPLPSSRHANDEAIPHHLCDAFQRARVRERLWLLQ